MPSEEKYAAALREYEEQLNHTFGNINTLTKNLEVARAQANQCQGAIKALKALLGEEEEEKKDG